jgi:hypothetical protein
MTAKAGKPSSRSARTTEFVAASVRAVVTRRGMVTRESESFGERVSACERKPGGCTRPPNALARTRERWGHRRDSENPGKKATNAKRRSQWLSAFLGNSCVRSARSWSGQLPERNTLRNNSPRSPGVVNAASRCRRTSCKGNLKFDARVKQFSNSNRNGSGDVALSISACPVREGAVGVPHTRAWPPTSCNDNLTNCQVAQSHLLTSVGKLGQFGHRSRSHAHSEARIRPTWTTQLVGATEYLPATGILTMRTSRLSRLRREGGITKTVLGQERGVAWNSAKCMWQVSWWDGAPCWNLSSGSGRTSRPA